MSLEDQWRKWSKRHPDKYGKPNIKLVAHISNRMYFIILNTLDKANITEFLLSTKSYSDRVELSGVFESDYTDNCLDMNMCKWTKNMKSFVKEMYKEQDLGIILSEILDSYRNLRYTPRNLPSLNMNFNDEINRIRVAYSVWLTKPKVMDIYVISSSDWNITIRTPHTNVLVTLKFIPGFQRTTEVRARIIEPRILVSDDVSFGGSLQYKGFTPCTARYDYLEGLLGNLYKVVMRCVIDEKDTSPYTDLEYKASSSRFDCHKDALFIYKAELDSKFNSNTTTLSLRDKRRAIQGKTAQTSLKSNITNDDMIGISEEVYDSKIYGDNKTYLYVKLTTELGICGYYRTIPIKGLHSKSILMNGSQLKDLGISHSKTKHLQVEYNPTILSPSRTIVVKSKNISNDDLLDYISNNIKVLCTGHTYTFILGKKTYQFDVLDSGNDKCSTLQVSSDTDVSIDILHPYSPGKKDPLGLSPSAYDETE